VSAACATLPGVTTVPVLLAFLKSKLARQIAAAVLLEVVAAIATKPRGKR